LPRAYLVAGAAVVSAGAAVVSTTASTGAVAVESTVVVASSVAGLLLQAERATTEAATKAKNTFFILFSFFWLG